MVQARLRTGFGTPSEFFAGLEKALQQCLANASGKQEESLHSGHAFQKVWGAWLLLELVDAVERNIFAAAHGSVDRPSPGQPVTTFFAGNRKVRQTLPLVSLVYFFV